MKAAIWRPIFMGLSPIMALIASYALLVTLALISLILINVPYFYDAQQDLQTYTDANLSADSRIDHFMVRNFFFLDGPDYYFELSLSPADRDRLVKLFSPGGQTEALNGNADQSVPASWQNGSQSIQRYCLHRPDKSQVLLFAVDANSNKAWLVVENF